MNSMVADSLVLVMTESLSLAAWREGGLLPREWAIYARLLPQYRRLVIVSYGGADDAEHLRSLLAPENVSKVVVVSNASKEPIETYAHAVTERVVEAVRDCSSVVIKTNQMQGGDVGVRIANRLREQGTHVGLIARGGYLWSRFVAHEHGPDSDKAIQVAAREQMLCRAADLVVGTTDEMVQDLSWRYSLDPLQTLVIPNYVLTDQGVRESASREKGLLLYAGQLVKRKRVDVLIRAAAMLPEERRSGVTLEIIGSGPDRNRLEALAAEVNAPVRFCPRVDHDTLRARMGSCSIYLQASELEGHPKTVIEAMAAGAPVVVADTPGLGVVVRHGVTGLRVEPTPETFAHAITELLSDEDWRDSLGSAAAATVRSVFGLPVIVSLETAAHRKALAFGMNRRSGSAAKSA